MPPEASSTEQVATPPDAYNAMASAFDELLVPEKPAAKPADTPSTTEVDAAAAAAKAPETPPADAAAPTAGAPAEGEVPAAPAAGNEPPAAPAAADATPPADTTDWKAKFEELQAQQREQPEPAPEPKPAAAAPPAQPERPIYTEDEKSFLKEYEANWDIVSRAESLKRRAEYRDVVSHVFSEFNRVYGPLIEQGALGAEQTAEMASLSIIRSVHPDYDMAMYNEVADWADTLTGMNKRAVQMALTDGEPADVADAITLYKEVKGKPAKVTAATPPAAPAAAPQHKATVTELSPQAKKAASALSPVDAKRSTPPNAPDPNDLDEAWKEALQAGT